MSAPPYTTALGCPPQSPAPGFGEKYWSLSGFPSHSLESGGGAFLTVIFGQIFAYSAFSDIHFSSPGSIGTPNSRHLRAEGLALVRLQHISPPRCVQSWQTPKRRCAPLAATVVSTWCRVWFIAVCSLASSESTARTRTSNGSRASAFLPLFVSRRVTLRPSASDRCRTKYPPASSALMACDAVPRVVA